MGLLIIVLSYEPLCFVAEGLLGLTPKCCSELIQMQSGFRPSFASRHHYLLRDGFTHEVDVADDADKLRIAREIGKRIDGQSQ